MEEKNMMREKLVHVLEKGRESVTQIRRLIDHHHRDGGSVNQTLKGQLHAHSSEVLTSLSSALSMIINNNSLSFNDPNLKPPNPTVPIHLHHVKSDDLHFGDGVAPNTSPKDARGCYKRRKTQQSVEIETLNIDDGHAWRKYGQKLIHKTRHPRHYYRCTHKTEQGCQATKQVQQISENPAKYKIIYYGHHTCKNPIRNSLMYLDLVDEEDNTSTNFLSFETSNNHKHGFYPSSSSSTSSSTSPPSPLGGSLMSNAMVEQEYKRIKVAIPSEPSDLHHEAPSPSSSSGFLPTTSHLSTTTATTGLSSSCISDEVISLAEICSSVITPHNFGEGYSYIVDDFFDFSEVFQD